MHQQYPCPVMPPSSGGIFDLVPVPVGYDGTSMSADGYPGVHALRQHHDNLQTHHNHHHHHQQQHLQYGDHRGNEMYEHYATTPTTNGKKTAGSNGSPGSKMKRKRIITHEQRHAANIRERRRMVSLNDAFDILRRSVPTFSYEKKLSRIETLRLAITYMAFLSDILAGKDPKDVKLMKTKHTMPHSHRRRNAMEKSKLFGMK